MLISSKDSNASSIIVFILFIYRAVDPLGGRAHGRCRAMAV